MTPHVTIICPPAACPRASQLPRRCLSVAGMLTRHFNELDHVTIITQPRGGLCSCFGFEWAAVEVVEGKERRVVGTMAHQLVKKAAIQPHTSSVCLSLLLMCCWSDTDCVCR